MRARPAVGQQRHRRRLRPQRCGQASRRLHVARVAESGAARFFGRQAPSASLGPGSSTKPRSGPGRSSSRARSRSDPGNPDRIFRSVPMGAGHAEFSLWVFRLGSDAPREACNGLIVWRSRTVWEGANETSPSKAISASGRGRCRAAGTIADRKGAGLSVTAGPDHFALPPGWCE